MVYIKKFHSMEKSASERDAKVLYTISQKVKGVWNEVYINSDIASGILNGYPRKKIKDLDTLEMWRVDI